MKNPCPNTICEAGRVISFDTLGRKHSRQCTVCLGKGWVTA